MTPISSFVDRLGQTAAGSLLGVCQAAVGRMLKNNRNIIIFETTEQPLAAVEIKPVGKNPESERLARDIYEQLTAGADEVAPPNVQQVA